MSNPSFARMAACAPDVQKMALYRLLLDGDVQWLVLAYELTISFQIRGMPARFSELCFRRQDGDRGMA